MKNREFAENINSFKKGEKELHEILFNEGVNYSIINDFEILEDLCYNVKEKKDIKLIIEEFYTYSKHNKENSVLKEKLLNILLNDTNTNDILDGFDYFVYDILNKTSLDFFNKNKDFFVAKNIPFVCINEKQKRKIYIESVYRDMHIIDVEENLRNCLGFSVVRDADIFKNQIELIKQFKEADLCFFNEVTKALTDMTHDIRDNFIRLFNFKESNGTQSQKQKYVSELLGLMREEKIKFSDYIRYKDLYMLDNRGYDVNILKYITQDMAKHNETEMLEHYKKNESSYNNLSDKIKLIMMPEYEKNIILNSVNLKNHALNNEKKRL